MEPTIPRTDFRLPRRRYPPMTGEERLAVLRSIRGMWKGKGQDIIKRLEAGRKDRRLTA